jgi:hypothetical protein
MRETPPAQPGDRPQRARRVTRRGFAAGSALVVGALAGCAGTSSGPTQANDPGPTANGTDPPPALQSFTEALTGENIPVESVSYTDDGSAVALAYQSADPGSSDTVTREIGTITGLFYNAIENGLEVGRLTATVQGPNGGAQIRWYAERAWYREFQNGELTADELTLRVVDTADPVDE